MNEKTSVFRKPTAITLNDEEREMLDVIGKAMNREGRSETVRALAREKLEELKASGAIAA